MLNLLNKILIAFVFIFLKITAFLPTEIIKAIGDKQENTLFDYLKHDGDINATTREVSYSPIHIALIYNANSIAKHLIENGCDLKLQDSYGTTPLMQAVFANNIELLTIILSKKVNLEVKNHKGRTALHIAAYVGFFQGVKLLTECGSNIYSKDKDNKKPIDLARYFLNENIRTLTEQQMENYNRIINFLKYQEQIDSYLKEAVSLPKELRNIIRLKLIKEE